MSTPRLDSGFVRRLARSLNITAFYDFPSDFAPGVRTYGEMYITDNATGMVLTNANQFYRWQTAWAASENSGFTEDVTNGTLTAMVAGTYRISFTFAADVTGANQRLEFAVFHNGVYQADHSMHIQLLGSFGNSASLAGILTLAVGDVIDVRVQNVSSPGQTLVIEDGNFNAS